MASNMREQLATLATLLRRILGHELPALGPDWWNQGVLAKLSYQQRAQADEQQWSTLMTLTSLPRSAWSTRTGICSGAADWSSGTIGTG